MRNQTPNVAKQDQKLTGRVEKRFTYNRRFAEKTTWVGEKEPEEKRPDHAIHWPEADKEAAEREEHERGWGEMARHDWEEEKT